MSEPLNSENITLKIVSENDANVQQDVDATEIETEKEHTPNILSVDGYTPTNNDDAKNILKTKQRSDLIDKYFMYYVTKSLIGKNKVNEKRGDMFKKYISKNDNNNKDLINIIESNKSRVRHIIRGGALKPKGQSSQRPSLIEKTRSKTVGTHIKKHISMSNCKDLFEPCYIGDKPISEYVSYYNLSNRENQNNTFTKKNDSSILESTLKNIINNVNKDTDVESLITQIRIEYTNNIETDSKQMILLNFEDDSFKAVIKISEQHIEIINKWYEICNQVMEIEETNIRIPNIINNSDISPILCKNIHCKHKDLFIKSYVPEILNNITIQNNIRTMESQMSIFNPKDTHVCIIKKSQTISDLNISIPKNMIYNEEYFYKKGNNVILCPKYNKSSINTDDSKNKVGLQGGTIKQNGLNRVNREFEVLNSTKSEESNNFFTVPKLIPENTYGTESDTFSIVNSFPTVVEDGYVAYNSEYDCLNPAFGSNMEMLEYKLNDDVESITSKLIIVLINPLFLQTLIVVEPDLLTLETIFEYTEYGFIELFTVKITNEEITELIKKQYDAVIFNNIDEINQVLLSTSQFIEFIKNKQHNDEPLLEEEKSVKQYLSKYFEISNDINKKMKASALYDTITRSDLCKIDKLKVSGFKNRLSTYLKDLGLQKKRYNDGYYYYGIVSRDLISPQSNVTDSREIRTIDDIKNDRAMLTSEMSKNCYDFFTVKKINN